MKEHTILLYTLRRLTIVSRVGKNISQHFPIT